MAAPTVRRKLAPGTGLTVVTAMLVGGGVGLIAVGYRFLLESTTSLAFDTLFPRLRALLGPGAVLLLPFVGGLIAGGLLHTLARDAKGHGVPEVMEAVALRGGRIRPAIMMNALASVFTIGFGGSAGRVAPVVQFGSGWGFIVGHVLRVPPDRLRNLVACGAAAGIAVTFNAPLAGVFFALEVILDEVETHTFSTIVLASVTGSVVGRLFLRDSPVFVAPDYAPVSSAELLFYVGLGGVLALGGVAFIRLLDLVTAYFSRLRWWPPLLPAAGGGLLGVLALAFPQVLGMGMRTVDAALYSSLSWQLMLLLGPAKIVATAFTLGSGGAGGVFAPALFIGAMLGGAYGRGVHQWFPALSAPAGSYAMIGMAGLFAAASRAPITSILMLFEMTRDVHILLPALLTTGVSVAVAAWLEPESIYTRKLAKAGIDLRVFRRVNLMQVLTVAEAMTPAEQCHFVTRATPLSELAAWFAQHSRRGVAVLATSGELVGVVTLSDLRRADEGTLTVGEICTTDVQVAFSDESLEDALEHFARLDVAQLPVVLRHAPRTWVGMLERADIIRAYARATHDVTLHRRRVELLRLQRDSGAQMISVTLREQDRACGLRLRELRLPEDCLLVSIRRGRETIIPRGETRLLAGDRLALFVHPSRESAIRRMLRHGPDRRSPDAPLTRRLHIELPPQAAAVGLTLRELHLPDSCIITAIFRQGRIVIPRGDTVLAAGDRLEVLVAAAEAAQVQQRLTRSRA